ncbi:MAG: hypothetical protein IPJ81_15635 [Chitinophagaceae bacterium]|nr:hypothetical protein [Chitinophagaceae bacterium]
MLKKISLILIILFYFVAGINHFRHPEAYLRLIPAYIPNHGLINIISGSIEIALAILFIFPFTRQCAAYGTVILLAAFIPAHVVMVQEGWCTSTGFCFPEWVIWLRLFPVQFILMWWAWQHRKKVYDYHSFR